MSDIPITLTQAATAAAQFLGVLDSGESLSTQQLADALAAANNLLSNWYTEQVLAMQELISEQTRKMQRFVDELALEAAPLAVAYTVAAGIYAAPGFTAPTFTPGTLPSFPDTITAISLANGYNRALKLGLAIELAPQYDIAVSRELAKNYTEARAAASPFPGKRPIPGMSALAEAPAANE